MDRRIPFLLISLSLYSAGVAQTVLDGAYIREHTLTRRAVPYVPLREADVMYATRVWREIDLREKINHPLYFPKEPAQGRKSLFDVIREAVLQEGSLTAYDPGPLKLDDRFTRAFSLEEVDSLLNPMTTTLTPSLDDPEIEVAVEQPTPVFRPATRGDGGAHHRPGADEGGAR
jgi:hypothetical protein